MPPTLPAQASPSRRSFLKWTAAATTSAAAALQTQARAQTSPSPAAPTPQSQPPSINDRLIGFVLAQEQFPANELVKLAAQATHAGFPLLATSDHFQPWESKQGNSGQAWVTLGAAGSQSGNALMGTHVTCPTLRYNPAVVAEAFATLDRLYPGRIFLGVGSGEALNEQAATGQWPAWQERWDRLIEALAIIRGLWTGQPTNFKGKYYTVDAKLYEPPTTQIPILTAANGPKAMALAGQYGDGLITDLKTWKAHKPKWQQVAQAAGKDPAKMPVMIEHFVVVGDKHAAQEAAEYWRFLPKAWKNYWDIKSPEEIQQKADAEVSLATVLKDWVVSEDPKAHIAGIQKLFDAGVTLIDVHSGQPNQQAVIDFYAQKVLPHFRA